MPQTSHRNTPKRIKYYNDIKEVFVGKKLRDRAAKFSSKVQSTTCYADSNQGNFEKIKNDHYISKIGEEAVCHVMRKFADKKNILGPDYKIYIGNKKSWDSDLKINGIELAVKTQEITQAKKYGLSWTFQCSDYRKDPILKDPNKWICFVEFDQKNGTCRVFPPFRVKDLKFRDPKLKHLIGKKQVVYAEDLPLKKTKK